MRRVRPTANLTGMTARTGGELSDVWELRAETGAVIVQVYADEWRWNQAKEAHVYRTLARHGVGPVPEVLLVEPAGDLLGRAFTVLAKLPGLPLSEVAPHLSDAQHHRLYRRLGEVLAAVHGIGQNSYGYVATEVVEPEPTNTAYMTRQFARKLAEFADLGGDPALHRAVGDVVAERAGLFARCAAPVLCHNDFHEGNVLVERGSDGWAVTGFIDVENAIAADPLLDLAKTDYYSVRGSGAKLMGLLEGYGSLPDDWRDRVALYELHHALELWDFFASTGSTAYLEDIADDLRRLAR
ncbi:MAG: aminoglycoside phosphotransferase family protein [Umezawaea sp.]